MDIQNSDIRNLKNFRTIKKIHLNSEYKTENKKLKTTKITKNVLKSKDEKIKDKNNYMKLNLDLNQSNKLKKLKMKMKMKMKMIYHMNQIN